LPRSRTDDLFYKEEVLQSYRWLFSAKSAEALQQLLDLPIPWWLVPLGEKNAPMPWHRSGTGTEKPNFSKRQSKWKELFSEAARFVSNKRQSWNKRATIHTLLKDINGRKCELPIDSKELLEYLGKEDEEGDNISETLPYERFPKLGPRVKVLMEFMEKQKPRGFFALWHDKRDSNSWYTFWAAVILGVGAFVLALAGLALASAQTWASFKALRIANG
jgi:hypothetical protein